MKTTLVNILLAVANLLKGPYRAAVQGLAILVQEIDLPDGDANWATVGRLVEEALQDMAAAQSEDESVQTQVRLAAERRVHEQLRGLGLIDVG